MASSDEEGNNRLAAAGKISTPAPAHLELIRSVFGAGGAAADKDPRFRALCAKLDINSGLPVAIKLMLIGIHLAAQQPEFTRKKKGAPKKRVSGDVLLSLFVDNLKTEPSAPWGSTDSEIVGLLKKAKAASMLPAGLDVLVQATEASLMTKISNGRGKRTALKPRD